MLKSQDMGISVQTVLWYCVKMTILTKSEHKLWQTNVIHLNYWHHKSTKAPKNKLKERLIIRCVTFFWKNSNVTDTNITSLFSSSLSVRGHRKLKLTHTGRLFLLMEDDWRDKFYKVNPNWNYRGFYTLGFFCGLNT